MDRLRYVGIGSKFRVAMEEATAIEILWMPPMTFVTALTFAILTVSMVIMILVVITNYYIDDHYGGGCIQPMDALVGVMDFDCEVWRMHGHDYLNLCSSSSYRQHRYDDDCDDDLILPKLPL